MTNRYLITNCPLFRNFIKKAFTIVLPAFLMFNTINGLAQNGPLKGSGKVVNKSFAFNDFDKIEFLDLDGKIEVFAGQPYLISANIDDNLESLLDITESDGTLRVKLKGNLYNRMYIEDTKISIKIYLPQVASIFHRSNGLLIVNGIEGDKLSIKNTGNGSAMLNGVIDELDIVCSGNGTVNAKNLQTKTLKVKKSGNGNVYVTAENIINNQSSGNGKVIESNSMKE